MFIRRRRFIKGLVGLASAVVPIVMRTNPVAAHIYMVSVLATAFPKVDQDPVLKQFPFKSVWGYLAADSLWLCSCAEGIYTLDERCPHCRARLRWQAASQQFGCPVCGSRFEASGDDADGPATYGMWHYWLEILDYEGNLVSDYMIHAPTPLTPQGYLVKIDVTVATNGRSRQKY